MVRQVQLIRESRFIDMSLQSCPTGKSSLASDGELRVAEAQPGGEDFSVRGLAQARMKFPDSLGRFGHAGRVVLQQVLGLVFEMIEVGIRWQASYRHSELPFVSPRSAFAGRKSVRENELLPSGGLLSFPRTGCALLRSCDRTTPAGLCDPVHVWRESSVVEEFDVFLKFNTQNSRFIYQNSLTASF
jgi:hypothetical protein